MYVQSEYSWQNQALADWFVQTCCSLWIPCKLFPVLTVCIVFVLGIYFHAAQLSEFTWIKGLHTFPKGECCIFTPLLHCAYSLSGLRASMQQWFGSFSSDEKIVLRRILLPESLYKISVAGFTGERTRQSREKRRIKTQQSFHQFCEVHVAQISRGSFST